MKTTQTKTLKVSLVGLLLMIGTVSYAQLIAPVPKATIATSEDLNLGTLNNDATDVVATVNTVLFYNPATNGPSITLRASLTDDSMPPLEFDSYLWYQITYNGTEEIATLIAGETGRDLSLTALQPGYHKYRVYGLVDNDGEVCQSDEFQDIIFFVLRPLAPTATTGTGAITEYCANDVPTGSLALEADVAYGAPDFNSNGYANPNIDAFNLTYRWYAINSNDPGTQIALTDPATGTNTGAENNVSVDYSSLTAPGTYTFYVEVQYSENIKPRDGREHAIWTAAVGGGTPYQLTVSPIPGRPTITIENPVD